ncbi:MAG: bifunctional adenosylcobinamide kinase/adenosylcobinamide-phosphate guanylyltransferase [Lachnospiraceae bacterium]|nr:bifunctional adenosylcobinamide kinase/adenosylcobinamide-phosphate guanylyltransferase [Ruminococcus sp.]MCM1273900.1 bifunctional adenosylcobinamide kinase/adenosylcobinamide-phosphate guanylyltransferase [Lachnospiraceae bacterium]
MSKSILITGGAASGKSRYAVTGFAAFDYVLYLKMGGEIDHDIRNRIEFDNNKHGVEWEIVSSDSLSPADEVKDHKFVIFDSVSSYTRLIMKEMFPDRKTPDDAEKKELEKRIIDDISAAREKVRENRGDIMIITLETGFSVIPEDGYFAAYREIVGRVNQRIANSSDEVYFSASGIQFKIK